MAANIESLPYGGSSGQSELRIMLLGNTRDDTKRVIKSILNSENLTEDTVDLCTIYKSDQAGRRISVVEAPEWERLLVKQTPEKMKEELERSASLCPPGPHALLLLIPVRSLCEDPSSGEMDSTLELMESLSDRVWRHTIVLFNCDEGVEELALKEQQKRAWKILEKCGGRSFVLHRGIIKKHELFRKIDDLVKKNQGVVFIPQTHSTEDLIKKKTKESTADTELRQRSGSMQKNPPNLKNGHSEENGKQ